jgi:hypothetical protein
LLAARLNVIEIVIARSQPIRSAVANRMVNSAMKQSGEPLTWIASLRSQ